jgi:hypothetical protein
MNSYTHIPCLYLQHFVWAGFNAWDHVGWTESDLLYFCKVVHRVSVQNQLANRYQWVFSMRPYLGIDSNKNNSSKRLR